LGGITSISSKHSDVEIERHPHIIGDERKVMDATQHRFTDGSRQLARPGSSCNRNGAHAFLPSFSNQQVTSMVRRCWTLSLTIYAALGLPIEPAGARQTGGVLKLFHRDSPASMSIHEEATISTVAPMMGVFNNLVLFKQDEKQNRPEFIQPELAENWSWDEGNTRLTFKLRQGVKWHDGKPFTAADVKCTWDMLLGKSQEKLRLNPRKSWYRNLDEIVPNGDYSVTFVLKRSQPAFLALLASGDSPVYPCHVSPRDMRTHPIGAGPFKFAVRHRTHRQPPIGDRAVRVVLDNCLERLDRLGVVEIVQQRDRPLELGLHRGA
jgi:hypothetical protein